jgi:hypothetical protein
MLSLCVYLSGKQDVNKHTMKTSCATGKYTHNNNFRLLNQWTEIGQ